ncbi:MAG TPA: hypothetical protein VOA87_16135 [Thermoanaerobaculia bacterium]|nr:hypothetical protein [Thermoanaerobaculia bacterium]
MTGRERRERCWRAPWAALLLPLVFAGALDIHPAGEAHDLLAGIGRRTVVQATSHKGKALHLHSATAEERPTCAACLLRLQTSGAHLPPSAVPAAPMTAGRIQPAAAPAAERYASNPRGARGPPLS